MDKAVLVSAFLVRSNLIRHRLIHGTRDWKDFADTLLLAQGYDAAETDGIVESTDYASKAWAIGGTGVTDTASRGAAKEWATKAEDSTVDGTEYSAKHYSAKAAASAVLAADAAASVIWNDVVFITNADSPYTIDNTHRGKLISVDCSGGNVVINLPGISGLDLSSAYVVGFKKTDTSGNTVTINADGTDEIERIDTKGNILQYSSAVI